jgi:hypothetical protein
MGKFKDQGKPAAALAEECSEVIKVITKLDRFEGNWNEIPDGHTETRWEQLCGEMEDVLYQWERLKKEVESKPSRMVYYIYHPKNGAMNHNCEPMTYMYDMVYKLEANSFEEAFQRSQNEFNQSYADKGLRSTSVGDIIMSELDYQNNRCHLVKGIGFEDVSSTWISYIDWGMIELQGPDNATIADIEQEMRNQH